MEQILQKTVVGDFSLRVPNFFVLAPLSAPTQQAVHSLQDQLANLLPADSLWLPRGNQLHTSFMFIVNAQMPLPPGQDQTTFFQPLKNDVLRTLAEIVPQNLDIALRPKRIGSSPPAVFIEWQDDGEYSALRQRFVQLFRLPTGVKPPPEIVHTTIARFRQEIDYNDVQKAVQRLEFPDIQEHTTEFHLVHAQNLYLQNHSVLASFPNTASPVN